MDLKYFECLVLAACVGLCVGGKINITSLDNCQDVPIHYDFAHVQLKNIVFSPDVDGFVDTLSGMYVVRSDRDPYEANELIITTYKCDLGTPSPCLDNKMEFVEPMSCAKFHENTGPWSMFSPAMHEGSKCGETPGEYEFSGANLKAHFLGSYIKAGSGRYRLKMLFHKKDTDRQVVNLKGCVELDFDII